MGVFVYEYPCTAGLNEGPLMCLAVAAAPLILPITLGALLPSLSAGHSAVVQEDYPPCPCLAWLAEREESGALGAIGRISRTTYLSSTPISNHEPLFF